MSCFERRYLFPLPLLPRHISRHGIANEWMEHLNRVATTIDTCDDTVASGRHPISSNGYIQSHFTIFRLRQSISSLTASLGVYAPEHIRTSLTSSIVLRKTLNKYRYASKQLRCFPSPFARTA
ncbi:unnamed protein product [Albugo candida]|uniref:Uncharacterized protein n=1 Tax=Albugo candida TaxID=65357 RepID=A0A024G4S2_9STRA|nr:unnamed protein product [Albugo candida]|eukprot:CCI41548.1 unnamed protein product [Albugo candida]